MYSHNLPLPNVLTLWTSFYTLIMRRSIALHDFISQTTLWNNVQQLRYIDSALETKKVASISYPADEKWLS